MESAWVAENLRRVEERIERARDRSGGGAVRIVAVTKTHGADAVRAAAAAGLTDCGENRVQELESKREAAGSIVTWHLIGHLQRNKVRRALPLFDMLQSLDSLRLAETLSAEADRATRDVAVLVQVNASGEVTKGGFDATRPDEVVEAVSRIAALPRLRVQGVMTMAPYTADEALLRTTFRRTRAVFEACRAAIPAFDARYLSMGMSNDFEMAVEEGSTMVRLGTVLFGERET
jgi:PLP dependent protein